MAEAAKVLPLPREIKLKPSGLTLAEHARRHHCISPPPTVTLADIMKPIYWHHVGRDLRPGDHIEVFPEDRSYYAELIVTASGDNTAKVETVVHKTFDAVEQDTAAIPEGYSIDWRGPNGRYAVVRTADKQVIQSNFVHKADAMKWMIDNRHTLVT